jgi:hypothetical protein
MALHESELEKASIIIVYDAIEHSHISRDRLREMIPEGDAQFIDTPSGPLIVSFQEIPDTNCIINARRIYLNQGGPLEPGSGHLAHMATVANEAVQGSNMVAYGLNFAVHASVKNTDNVGRLLRDKFLKRIEELEAETGGSVAWLSPKFKYIMEDVEYQLSIEPVEGEATLVRAHLNVHHTVQSLPTQDELSTELNERFQYMSGLLDRLLSE